MNERDVDIDNHVSNLETNASLNPLPCLNVIVEVGR